MRYVRVVDCDGKRYYLRVTRETATLLAGIEVDEDGDEVVPRGHHNRLRVVAREAIVRCDEMRMNNHYATLEPVVRS